MRPGRTAPPGELSPARQIDQAQTSLQLLPPAGVAAAMPWRGVLQTRVVQLRHGAGAGAAWRQPSCLPRQRPPAVPVMARCVSGSAPPHRPLGAPQPTKLRRQRPGAVLQVVQVAAAVERPAVDVARPAAPVAGLRGARTGVVGLGPADAFVALVDPRSGRDADLPEPARLPAAHQVSPPLAWLPGSDQPTKQAGTAQPEPHGAHPPYSPAGGPAGHGLVRRPARRRHGRRVVDHGSSPGRQEVVVHVRDDVIKASVLDHGPDLPAQPQPMSTPTRWAFAAAGCGCCAGSWMRCGLSASGSGPA